jgi:membrane-associated phospholipid phosphatase
MRPASAGHPARMSRFGARAVFAAAALVLVAVPFGLLLFLVQDQWSPLLRVDAEARDDFHSVAVDHHWLVTAMKVLSTIGSALVYFPLFAAVAGWLLWKRHSPRLALFMVVTVAGSALVNALVKLAVHRARPVLPDPVAHATGLSFPSGHAQSAIVAAAVLLLVFRPRPAAVAAAVVFVVAIGASRIGLGVHYLSDVLAGYVLGAAWVAAMIAAFNASQREAGRATRVGALGHG